MPYGECKIYFDGSHYIGIPHTTRPSRRREKPPEEEIVVTEKEAEPTTETEENIKAAESAPSKNDDAPVALAENIEEASEPMPEMQSEQPKARTMTRKELFEELYQSTAGQSKSARKKFIVHHMKPYFKDEKSAVMYVNAQFERKYAILFAGASGLPERSICKSLIISARLPTTAKSIRKKVSKRSFKAVSK